MARLMERHPKLALNALRFVAGRLHELQVQYRQLATEKVERRVARALLRLVQQAGRRIDSGVLIDLPLSRDDIAQMTGTTLFTVSRIISRFEAEGILEAGRQRILIRNPHGLLKVADDLI
jgi:CRP-like cAMP-binding protein